MTGAGKRSDFGSQLRRALRNELLSAARLILSCLAVVQTTFARMLVKVPASQSDGSIRRILVVRLDELGDLVMTWPLIDALRSSLPEAELTLLVNRSLIGITEGMNDIRVLGVDVKCNRLFRPLILPLRHYRFVQKHLRDERFDLCLLPRRDSDDVAATALAYFTRAGRRISFSEKSTVRRSVTNRSFDSLLTDVLPPPPVQHETTANLILLGALGLSPAPHRRRFPVPGAAVRFAEHNLPPTGAPYVAICPSSGHSELKQWGAERFAEVARRLTASGTRVVLIGGPADSHLGSVIQNACEGKCLDFISKTSLSEMAALLGVCTAFIGNDAGPMHVASALGVPTVGIFGSSCRHQFGPWSPQHSVIAHEIDCSPCRLHAKNRCDVCIYGEPVCLHRIAPEEVLEALSALAGGQSKPCHTKRVCQ